MYYSYSRYYPKNSFMIRFSAIIFVSIIIDCFLMPFTIFIGALFGYKYKVVTLMSTLLVSTYITIKISPKTVNIQLEKDKYRGFTKLFPYLILDISIIWAVFVGMFMGNVISSYGLDGWLLQFIF